MSAPMIDLAPGHKIGLIVENPVLLAPAAASFDQYPNFEKRGDHFAALVRDLIGDSAV